VLAREVWLTEKLAHRGAVDLANGDRRRHLVQPGLDLALLQWINATSAKRDRQQRLGDTRL
jgi:hypothetical protein